MKESNQPEEIKEENTQEERPYMGYKKEELVNLLDNLRSIFNSLKAAEDKNFSRKKIVEIENELKKRY